MDCRFARNGRNVSVVSLQYFWDKKKQESVIQSSSLDWKIVRPGALNNNQPKGK